jgi:hypothetical protein
MIATEQQFHRNQCWSLRLSPTTFEAERLTTEIPMTNQNPNPGQQNPGQQNQNPGQKPGQQQGGGQKPGQQQQDPSRQGQKPNPGQQGGR